jgi:hypothetical protein
MCTPKVYANLYRGETPEGQFMVPSYPERRGQHLQCSHLPKLSFPGRPGRIHGAFGVTEFQSGSVLVARCNCRRIIGLVLPRGRDGMCAVC